MGNNEEHLREDKDDSVKFENCCVNEGVQAGGWSFFNSLLSGASIRIFTSN